MRKFAPWALVSGLAGVIANILLIAFYALTQPWRHGASPYGWLGTANDAIIPIQFAALIPVAEGLRTSIQEERVGWFTRVAQGDMVMVAALQLMLITRILNQGTEFGLVTVFIAVVFVWVFVISRAGHRRGVLTQRMARFGMAVGAALPIAVVVVVLSLLLPAKSWVQYVSFGIGGVIGLFGWLAFPLWTMLLAQPFDSEGRTGES